MTAGAVAVSVTAVAAAVPVAVVPVVVPVAVSVVAAVGRTAGRVEFNVIETRPSNRSSSLASMLSSCSFVFTPHSVTSRARPWWSVLSRSVITGNVFLICTSSGSSISSRESSTSSANTLIVVSHEYGVAPERMRGKFASHNYRVLQQHDTELL